MLCERSLEVQRLRVIVRDDLVRIRRYQKRGARAGIPETREPAVADECGPAGTGRTAGVRGDESALSEEGGELDLGAAGVAVRVFEHDDRLWRRCCLGVVLRGCLGVRASAGIQALLQRRPAGGVEVAVRGDTEDDLVEGEFRARPCFDARGSA